MVTQLPAPRGNWSTVTPTQWPDVHQLCWTDERQYIFDWGWQCWCWDVSAAVKCQACSGKQVNFLKSCFATSPWRMNTVIRLTTWHWTTCLGGFIWKTWLVLSGFVRPPAVGAWLTSSVTPPVVFCHLCSLTTESKCGGQVFSQHMMLKIASGGCEKEETQQFEIGAVFFFFCFCWRDWPARWRNHTGLKSQTHSASPALKPIGHHNSIKQKQELLPKQETKHWLEIWNVLLLAKCLSY